MVPCSPDSVEIVAGHAALMTLCTGVIAQIGRMPPLTCRPMCAWATNTRGRVPLQVQAAGWFVVTSTPRPLSLTRPMVAVLASSQGAWKEQSMLALIAALYCAGGDDIWSIQESN